MWQKVFENDAFCGIMHETAAEQKESRSPEVPAEIVILFILMTQTNLLEYLKGISTDRADLIRFAHYMEALVAFHRYFGGKEG